MLFSSKVQDIAFKKYGSQDRQRGTRNSLHLIQESIISIFETTHSLRHSGVIYQQLHDYDKHTDGLE